MRLWRFGSKLCHIRITGCDGNHGLPGRLTVKFNYLRSLLLCRRRAGGCDTNFYDGYARHLA